MVIIYEEPDGISANFGKYVEYTSYTDYVAKNKYSTALNMSYVSGRYGSSTYALFFGTDQIKYDYWGHAGEIQCSSFLSFRITGTAPSGWTQSEKYLYNNQFFKNGETEFGVKALVCLYDFVEAGYGPGDVYACPGTHSINGNVATLSVIRCNSCFEMCFCRQSNNCFVTYFNGTKIDCRANCFYFRGYLGGPCNIGRSMCMFPLRIEAEMGNVKFLKYNC